MPTLDHRAAAPLKRNCHAETRGLLPLKSMTKLLLLSIAVGLGPRYCGGNSPSEKKKKLMSFDSAPIYVLWSDALWEFQLSVASQ